MHFVPTHCTPLYHHGMTYVWLVKKLGKGVFD